MAIQTVHAIDQDQTTLTMNEKVPKTMGPEKILSYARSYENLTEILTDHQLASFGDTYANFAYSIALSKRRRELQGIKVKGTALAEALKKAGLREHLPSGMSRHTLADAAEALLAYAWLKNHVTLAETVNILEKTEDPVEGFAKLLMTIKKRIRLS